MGYREIILIVLSSRESLICKEDRLLNDFNYNVNPQVSFQAWCSDNAIEYKRLQQNMIKLKKVGDN
jgi:hypothetical protein